MSKDRFGRIWDRFAPTLTIPEVFPPIEQEFGPYRKYFKGHVLNAGAGNRDIRSLVEGKLYNQDIATGLHNANIDILSPLHKIPVEAGFFDTIICNAVLEHVENPEEVMKEFRRVCKLGGILYLCIPFMQPEHRDPADFQRYTIDGLKRLVEQHEFEVIQIEGVHSVYTTLAWIFHEWLNARKSFSHFLFKLFFFPYLKRKCRTSRFHVHSLASAYRVVAKRVVLHTGEGKWTTSLAMAYRRYQKPANAYGMTTRNELCMVETYARYAFTGAGKIVDLGCWFGATTICLARGLADNVRASSNRLIEAYDLFVWQEWMDRSAKAIRFSHRYHPGDCFYEDVKKLLDPYRSTVRLHKQDLTVFVPPPEPIEFLFIDAMKLWKLANQIVAAFFPRLIEGVSYIVQQDFAYHHAAVANNHLIMWYLRDHFQFVYHVPDSCSVVFMCTKQVDASKLPVFTESFFNLEMINEAYEYSRPCVLPNMQSNLQLTKLEFLLKRGYTEAAQTLAEQLKAEGVALTEGILTALQSIHSHPSVAPSGKSG